MIKQGGIIIAWLIVIITSIINLQLSLATLPILLFFQVFSSSPKLYIFSGMYLLLLHNLDWVLDVLGIFFQDKVLFEWRVESNVINISWCLFFCCFNIKKIRLQNFFIIVLFFLGFYEFFSSVLSPISKSQSLNFFQGVFWLSLLFSVYLLIKMSLGLLGVFEDKKISPKLSIYKYWIPFLFFCLQPLGLYSFLFAFGVVVLYFFQSVFKFRGIFNSFLEFAVFLLLFLDVYQ